MPLGSPMRAVGKYSSHLLKRAEDAQRHHRLTFSFAAYPSGDLRTTLRLLARLGLITHVRATARPCSPNNGRTVRRAETGLRLITCTLRYLEGEPVTRVATTPSHPCTYHDIKRRLALGGGVALLVWADGALRTGRECLVRRQGGLLVATLVT